MEDSWFWDSEKSPSSASSKDNENSSAHNLTSVSLLDDDKHAATGVVEKLRRTIDEKNDEIKRLNAEAIEQRECVERLRNENNEINLQIEQLDQQHSDAVDRVLTVKNDLQKQCQRLESDSAAMRADHIVAKAQFEELTQQHADLLRINEELIVKYDLVEANCAKALQDNANMADEKNLVRAELERRMIEISELTLALEEKEREAIEKFEIVEMEKEKMMASASADAELLGDEQKMTSSADDRCDSSASMVSVEEQLMQLRTESDALVEELKIAREATRKAEDLKSSYEALNADKASILGELEQLQLAHSTLQKSHVSLKRVNKELEIELNANNNKHQQEVSALDRKCSDLSTQLDKLRSHVEALKEQNESQLSMASELAEVKDAYAALKTEASDLENRLVQENVIVQKQVLDLQSELDSRQSDAAHSANASIALAELRAILSQQMNYTSPVPGNNAVKPFITEFVRSMKSTYQKLQENEFNREDLMKQFESVNGEKANMLQEIERLKMELNHFETEVGELMKNNEILLVELENVKAGKLEPISEHNEDSIVDLEKQLEDVSVLNQSLEDEYKNLRFKMDEKEEEKYELIEKLEATELQYAEQAELIDKLKQQIVDLDAEKSNILFELNEYKTDNVSSVADSDELRAKVEQQAAEIIDLRQEFDEMLSQNAQVNKYLQMQEKEVLAKSDELTKALETTAELEARLATCKCNAEPQIDAEEMVKCREELKDFQNRFDDKLHEMSMLEQQCQAQEVRIADLQSTVNRLESQSSTDVSAQYTNQIDVLNREKQELIAAVQQKHNESVEYHAQIQQLNQMLNVAAVQKQQQQNVPCQHCHELSEQLKVQSAEVAKVNDQITFLREKSDILMGNLMTEQNNQKMLSQEKIDLVEEKQTMSKELTRLREHLIELENAHTAEMVELQNDMEQTKQQMTSMQEEAKKSSTAYTSAR